MCCIEDRDKNESKVSYSTEEGAYDRAEQPEVRRSRKVLITVVPLILVVIQLVIERQIDVATLGLVAIALLP